MKEKHNEMKTAKEENTQKVANLSKAFQSKPPYQGDTKTRIEKLKRRINRGRIGHWAK